MFGLEKRYDGFILITEFYIQHLKKIKILWKTFYKYTYTFYLLLAESFNLILIKFDQIQLKLNDNFM